jgi:hypothetical protein
MSVNQAAGTNDRELVRQTPSEVFINERLHIMTAPQRLSIIHQSPAYWRVVIGNPPLNLFDPVMFAELNVLMDDIEKNQDLKVVVFESSDADFL